MKIKKLFLLMFIILLFNCLTIQKNDKKNKICLIIKNQKLGDYSNGELLFTLFTVNNNSNKKYKIDFFLSQDFLIINKFDEGEYSDWIVTANSFGKEQIVCKFEYLLNLKKNGIYIFPKKIVTQVITNEYTKYIDNGGVLKKGNRCSFSFNNDYLEEQDKVEIITKLFNIKNTYSYNKIFIDKKVIIIKDFKIFETKIENNQTRENTKYEIKLKLDEDWKLSDNSVDYNNDNIDKVYLKYGNTIKDSLAVIQVFNYYNEKKEIVDFSNTDMNNIYEELLKKNIKYEKFRPFNPYHRDNMAEEKMTGNYDFIPYFYSIKDDNKIFYIKIFYIKRNKDIYKIKIQSTQSEWINDKFILKILYPFNFIKK